MRNVFDGYIDTFSVAKERTSELEENTNFSNRNAKRKKVEENIQEPWDNCKSCNICKNGTQEGE